MKSANRFEKRHHSTARLSDSTSHELGARRSKRLQGILHLVAVQRSHQNHLADRLRKSHLGISRSVALLRPGVGGLNRGAQDDPKRLRTNGGSVPMVLIRVNSPVYKGVQAHLPSEMVSMPSNTHGLWPGHRVMRVSGQLQCPSFFHGSGHGTARARSKPGQGMVAAEVKVTSHGLFVAADVVILEDQTKDPVRLPD